MAGNSKLLTYGALGIGAYWLYSKFADGGFVIPGMQVPAPGNNTQPAGAAPPMSQANQATPNPGYAMQTPQQQQQAPQGTNPIVPAPVTVAPEPLAPPIVSGARLEARAAYGESSAIQAADAAGIRLNFDQWNYYRAESGKPQITVDLFPEGNRGVLVLASEYQNRLRQVGLSGWLF